MPGYGPDITPWFRKRMSDADWLLIRTADVDRVRGFASSVRGPFTCTVRKGEAGGVGIGSTTSEAVRRALKSLAEQPR